jgi:hypothetical protein
MLFICKIAGNEKPCNLHYIYMQPGGNYEFNKDILPPPPVHSPRFKEILHVAKDLPLASNMVDPSNKLALKWYNMFYHKNNRNKFICGQKALNRDN